MPSSALYCAAKLASCACGVDGTAASNGVGSFHGSFSLLAAEAFGEMLELFPLVAMGVPPRILDSLVISITNTYIVIIHPSIKTINI